MQENIDLGTFNELIGHIEFIDYILKTRHNYYGLDKIKMRYKAFYFEVKDIESIIESANQDEKRLRKLIPEEPLLHTTGIFESWGEKLKIVKQMQHDCLNTARRLYLEYSAEINRSPLSKEKNSEDLRKVRKIGLKFISSLEEDYKFDPIPINKK